MLKGIGANVPQLRSISLRETVKELFIFNRIKTYCGTEKQEVHYLYQ